MNKLKQLCAVAIFTIIVSCSSSDPQTQLMEIDKLKNSDFAISTEQMENIDKLVADGQNLLSQDKDKEASEALKKAIAILNMARDAHIFNKAD